MKKAFSFWMAILAFGLALGARPAVAQSGDPWADCIKACNQYYIPGSQLWHLCRQACGPPPTAPLELTEQPLATRD